REVDQEAYFRHIYSRVRGRAVHEDSTSLTSGAGEVVTLLGFDLQGFSDYARGLDPGEVLMTLNQLMADLTGGLERHRAQVAVYSGDAFMALLREGKHAERGVHAALDLMAALEEFDRPRRILGLPEFQARIAVCTGPAFMGNVGTYHKLDFTVLGPAVTPVWRLLNSSDAGLAGLCAATYAEVADRCASGAGSPRLLAAPGMRECEEWDVVGRK